MWRRCSARAAAAAAVCCAAAAAATAPAGAQSSGAGSASVWLDGSAALTRPPSDAIVDAARYGLLGMRLRVDDLRSAFEAAATAGRGAEVGSGAWLSGSAALHSSRVRGALDYGVRGDAAGLMYLTPLRTATDDEYSQQLATAGAAPFVGLSVARFRLAAELSYMVGRWQSTLRTPGTAGPGLPLPGLPDGSPGSETVTAGNVTVAGGAASLLRVLGPATLELRATHQDVRNGTADGVYAGIDGRLALSLGPVDLSGSVRRWNSPLRRGEVGGHVGLGVSVGPAAYLQVAASRTITDALHGTPGGTSASAGISMRLGRRALGPAPPAAVGAAVPEGRRVRFTLRRDDARSVTVAGDFSGWEQRALQRGSDGTWTLETVLPPGVYHYSFVIDGEWSVPPNATGLVDDGFGRRNATLIVNDTGDNLP
jgi:hypothetical protein